MAEVNPAEVSAILRDQLAGVKTAADLEEVGTVLYVGDGIARIYGMSQVQSGELIEFDNGLMGIVLNLEEDNVGAVLLGSSNKVREGDTVKRTGRIAYGTELNPKYHNIAIRRDEKFEKNIINGDAKLIDTYGFPQIDFSISSPPYWDILNRSTGSFKKVRDKKQLDTKYSEHNLDLGNIDDYDEFIKSCAEVYVKMYDILRVGAHIVIIIKNVKKDGKFYPLAWDLAKELSSSYELKDEKIWIQDKIGLAPYGYPFSWTSNILHHYCLILKKV